MWGPSTQMRWAGEVAIPLLCRESHGDAPDRPPPPRLWTVLIHVVRKRLCRIHPDQPHRPQSSVLRQNCDRWDDIVCVPIPNAGIDCSSSFTEEGLARNCLLYCSLRAGAFTDLPAVEPEHSAVPLSPISRNSSAGESTGSTI